MKSIQLKKVADQLFYEMWNEQKLRKVDELFADQFEIHYGLQTVNDRETFKQLLQQWFAGIPDLKHEIDDYICEENKIAIRWHGSGTHTGEFLNIPPTAKAFYYCGITILELDSAGKIRKAWVNNDLTDMVIKLKDQAC